MEIKTVVKKLKETKDSDGVVTNEYIIYRMIDKQPISAILASGEDAMNDAVLKYNN